MIKQYSIAEARNHFAAVVHEVEATEMIELTRRGEPVAVLLSLSAYQRLQTGRRSFKEAYQAFQEQTDLVALHIEPDWLTGTREQTPGREVNW